MSGAPRFIHLRTHTEHSLLEGAVPVKKLVELCVKAQMPAVAVTDTNNMFAALEFSVTAIAAGVQPIIGCQIALAHDPAQPGERPRPPAPIVLLAQDEAGYRNLMQLNSCLYIDGTMSTAANMPQVTLDELSRHAQGLICLTGGPEGPLGRFHAAGQHAKARALLDRLTSIYPDRLYVELQRHPGPGGALSETEALAERGAIDLAYAMNLPIVATNDVYFPKTSMYEAHDALICIAEGAYVDQQQPRRRLTPQHYFKSESEMAALFADLPEALENTVEIAKRCAFAVNKHAPILPKFADDEVQELRRLANEGLQARLRIIPHSASPADYQARLDFELGVIESMGFPGYFLIVADFINWAKERGIPVGPGRGSGAGSLVAYALRITDLDPLRYALLFERFLNPERVSMPDFDIDFCMDRREEVITYVQEKYGRDRVAQIITFGALLSKAAVRDVGRVLQMSYTQVDKLSKMIPVEGVKPVSITKALADEPRLREAAKEEVVKRLLDYAREIEGLYRNASTHAAGVVIGDRPLDQLVPLYRDPRSDMPATQFNMKWVEAAGLVKFDFLGLKTLTVIQNAMDLLALRGISFDINLIPLDDQPAYDLYAAAKTVAVFQVESSGMMDALRRMKPTCIEDIVALVALYRPGPMENIPAYCEVKNGLKPLESIHPTIDHILAETQGIIVYQEQVMQIAQVMAGYSLGGADLLRRAMGKKNPVEMARERPKFIEGAKATHGIPEAKAGEVFDLLEKFANYGFNKSHAAAYAVVSYQTAYLKANYPAEFMAAVMNCDIHLTDKLAVYKREVDKLGLKTVAPCINASLATFTVRDGAIVYGLGALKNVGVDAMQLIVQARRAHTAHPDQRSAGNEAGRPPASHSRTSASVSQDQDRPHPPSPPLAVDGGAGHSASPKQAAASAPNHDHSRAHSLPLAGHEAGRPLDSHSQTAASVSQDQDGPRLPSPSRGGDGGGGPGASHSQAAASAPHHDHSRAHSLSLAGNEAGRPLTSHSSTSASVSQDQDRPHPPFPPSAGDAGAGHPASFKQAAASAPDHDHSHLAYHSQAAARSTPDQDRATLRDEGPTNAARLEEDHEDRPFATLFDLARRVDLKRIGKRPLEMLARAGCFDVLDPNRARVFEALDPLTAYSAAIHDAAASAQVSLFGTAGADIPEPRLPFRDDWLPVERLAQEHLAIGFYLSGHPLDDYMSALRRQKVETLAQVAARAERGPLTAKLAGSVSARQERKSARGNRFAFVQLSDPTGLYEVTCFSEVLEASRDHLEPGQNVILTVRAELEGETLKLLAQSVQPMDAVTAQSASDIRIHLARAEAIPSLASLLARVAHPDTNRSRAQITLCITDAQGREVDIALPATYPVTPQIKGAIKSLTGVLAVEDL